MAQNNSVSKFLCTNLKNLGLKTPGQHKFWQKKIKNCFSIFFFKYTILFCSKLNCRKNAFFCGIAWWNSSKITKFEIFAHIFRFWVYSQFFAIFLGDPWKFFSKNRSNELKFMPSFVGTYFLTIWCLQSQERWGGPLQGSLTLALLG